MAAQVVVIVVVLSLILRIKKSNIYEVRRERPRSLKPCVEPHFVNTINPEKRPSYLVVQLSHSLIWVF